MPVKMLTGSDTSDSWIIPLQYGRAGVAILPRRFLVLRAMGSPPRWPQPRNQDAREPVASPDDQAS
jgi:hypothetical protein